MVHGQEPLLAYLENVDVSEKKQERLLYAGTACVPSGSYVPWFPGTDRKWRCIGR